MKKILLSLLAIVFALVSNAQITLTISDAPSIGDAFVLIKDSVSVDTLTPRAEGTSIAWDFSSLQNSGYDTSLFIDPVSTAFAADFPTANMINRTNLGDNYLNKTSSLIEAVGFILGDTLALNFDDNLTYFQFPMTYGNSFNDQASVDFKMKYDTTITVSGFPVTIDSVRLKRNINYNKSITGWGSLVTPTSTYNDVLKTKTHEIDIDSTWMHTSSLGWVSAQNSKDSTDTYEWYKNGLGIALLSINVKHDTTQSVNYFHATIININNNKINSGIKVYPNPVNENLNFVSENKINSIEIFDLTGKSVILQTEINNKIKELNVSNLKQGIYFYKLIDNKGNIKTQKFIKQ
ncbi:MAG: hypothetical protein DRI94_14210 [Bacteroidetes bacterium]|nr:MAG: hypothetical protein DRI94_14210 [Bacteroidota bacterium]